MPANLDGIERSQKDGQEEFTAYVEYNRILRSWFVAFGVGGPALFLTNAELGKRLAATGELKLVATLFLLGTCAQVLGAALNKACNWYVYHGAGHPEFRSTCRYHLSHRLVYLFGFDVVLDAITFVLFGVSAWQILTVFGS